MTPPSSEPTAQPVRFSWPLAALVLLSLLTLIGFFVYPTYPNYDSYYSLIWGRELLHFQTPTFDTYYAPTQHPLAVAFGALLSLLGRGADRVMVFCTLVSFVVLVAGVYRIGRLLFTPAVGLVAGAILCTRFDFPFLAARAYIDIPYLALIVWAIVLGLSPSIGRRQGARPASDRKESDVRVWLLLLAAGLLRPEAWLLLGFYGLWLAWLTYQRERSLSAAALSLLRSAAISVIAPLVWCLSDWLVTGDPLFSLTHTASFAEELGRTKGASEIPRAMRSFFFNLTKAPVLAAGILGVALAFWFVPKRALLPAALWLIGSGTFVLVGLAGLSVIDRYLLVPSLMVMLFAAVTIAGWTMLNRGWVRNLWAVLAVLAVAYGAMFTVLRVNPNKLTSELERRGKSHRALVELLDRPELRDSCVPFSTPSHKLVPEVRWITGLGEPDVRARSEAVGASNKQLPAEERAKRRTAAKRLSDGGTALYVVERGSILRQALVTDRDDIFTQVPVYVDHTDQPGYERIGFNTYYSAYARCPTG